jgi:S-adenosylmethionine decarboxylase proenzyme
MPLARHTLLELHGCDPALLANRDALRPLLVEVVRAAGATIVTDVFHDFTPHGVSGVIVIAESHVAIHTWPEHRYAAVDIFSCSPVLDQQAMAAGIQKTLAATSAEARVLERGCSQ